ncbi:MAG: asparagine synthetase B family protein [Vicinamibacterales bacterium]
MSALAGIVRFDGGRANADAVALMIDCVEHRGRSWRDVRAEGPIAFAYRWHRLGAGQPVDEQPAVDPVDGSVIVFDGRLDNRDDLLAALDLRGRNLSDAGVVLAAHRAWGDATAERLLGDFAFALWDPRTRRLTLARDPLGVRAIAYAAVPGGIAFATEPRQLLRVSEVDRRPDMGFVAECVAGIIVSRSDTIFRGVRRVPAAHVATATSDGIRVVRYWDVDPGRQIRYADDREYPERLRELYDDAVRARVRGVDRVAIALSGGVDSSSVLGVTARVTRGGPVGVGAYTHALRGFADADEERYAEAAARHCDVPLVAIPFESTGLASYRSTARRLEDTMPGTLGSGDLALAARASADGSGVMFLGVGGDEWLTGVVQHSADLLRRGRLVAAARQVWADAHNPDAFHGLRVQATTCVWAALPGGARRFVKRILPARDHVPPGFNRAFADDVSLVDRLALPLVDARFPTLASGAAYAAATHPHGCYAWEEGARQAGLFEIELSAPLLDRRIAEFAIALPESQRWQGREAKRVLRAAMQGDAPDLVRLRNNKCDPSAVQVAELERVHADGAFRSPALVEAGVLDPAAIDRMYEEMRRRYAARDVRYKLVADRLWSIFARECAWRALFGRDAVMPPSRSSRSSRSSTVVGACDAVVRR